MSYVSDELVGLKAATIVDGRVAAGDTVTLVIDKGETMVAAQARVLSASGSFIATSYARRAGVSPKTSLSFWSTMLSRMPTAM